MIAAALVVGQLALCSVIGWVTFGDLLRPATNRADSIPLSEPLAPAPTSAPVPSVSPAAEPTTPSQRASPSRRAGTATTKRPSPDAVTSSSTAGKPKPKPTADAVLLPAPSESEAVQEPVRRWATCSPEDSLGRTEDGAWVRCWRTRDGELRWHTV
jgi:hypothetical protein